MIEALSINKKIEVVVEEGNKEHPEVEMIEMIEMIEIDTITRAIVIIIAIAKDQEIVMNTADAVRIQEIRVEIEIGNMSVVEIEIENMRVVEIEIIITTIAIVIIKEIINKILETMIDVLEIIAQATINHIRKIMKTITNDQAVVDIKGMIIHMIEIISQ